MVRNSARQRLINRALSILDEGNRLLAVPFEEFFDGNTDEQSIGVNLPPHEHIGLEGFRRVLSEIRKRADVRGVFLELTEIPDLEEEEDAELWPTASGAIIVTSADIEEVKAWVAPLHPREVSEGWGVQPGVKTPLTDHELGDRMRPVRVWLL